MKPKQILKSPILKTLFFRGNYQFLPTVIFFWYAIFKIYQDYFDNKSSFFFSPALTGIQYFVIFVLVFAANMIGIIIVKLLIQLSHKLKKRN